MKRKTKTLKVEECLHSRIKKHVKPLGVKIEAWVGKTLKKELAR